MRLFIVLAVGAILLGAGVAIAARVIPPVYEYTLYEHVVQPGDTLWTIARKYAPRGHDLRKVVHNIKIASNLESAVIYPGQLLMVPVEEVR